MTRFIRQSVTLLLLALVSTAAVAQEGRGNVQIRDLCRLRGIRDNELIGYGLVTGLDGTGDGDGYLPAIEAVRAVLEKLSPGAVAMPAITDADSVAVVVVTAKLPAFNKAGEKINVNVSSVGPASSLSGGTLLVTPLQGPAIDNVVYAVASGSLKMQGANTKNAVIIDGATVERAVKPKFVFNRKIYFELSFKDADFTLAKQIADQINDKISGNEWAESREIRDPETGVLQATQVDMARAIKADTIEVDIPELFKTDHKIIGFISELERISFPPQDGGALIVINRHTKTIVATGDVQISPGIVMHGDLTVQIAPPGVPPEAGSSLIPLPGEPNEGSNLDTVLRGLRQFKATPDDMIEIILQLKRSKLLRARVVMVDS